MGVVFLAEQEAPVRRTVALKVIKPGMDTAQVIARLEAERQALAMMDHPHIARFLDAGTTDSGRPYFVMEPVEGLPITEYCDRNRLTPKERLELFVPVCQAIQHAHQKGIIHRDVKPSNVLVALAGRQAVAQGDRFRRGQGDRPAADREDAVHAVRRDRGDAGVHEPGAGTSERAGRGHAERHLFAGRLALRIADRSHAAGAQRLREAAFTEVLRRNREEEPPKPSTRLGPTQETASIAASRGPSRRGWRGWCAGDLDWIVMKALEKPARRYETANGLARDIRRHLEGDPVEAGPPSAAYRLRKLARKHGAALATASAFAACCWRRRRSAPGRPSAPPGQGGRRRERDTAIDARGKAEARRRAEAAKEAARVEAGKAARSTISSPRTCWPRPSRSPTPPRTASPCWRSWTARRRR